MNNSCVNLQLKKVNGKTTQDLLDTLTEIMQVDADHSGENGPGYIWEEAKNKGFETNIDFLVDLVKDEPSHKEIIDSFMTELIERDFYYTNSDYEVIYDEEGRAECIAFAFASEE